MSEPDPTPGPVPPAAHETPSERLADLFHHARTEPGLSGDVAAVADDLEPVLASLLGGVLAHAGRVFSDPQLKPLRAEMLGLAASALRIGGILTL